MEDTEHSLCKLLFKKDRPLPMMPGCVHLAGRPEFIQQSLNLQQNRDIPFDLLCDIEDGAPVGSETQHRIEIIDLLSAQLKNNDRVGLRIHEYRSPHWKLDVDEFMEALGQHLSFICIPKAVHLPELTELITYIQNAAYKLGIATIPIHVIIETPQALRLVWEIARLEHVECLDFGIMDFVAVHRGAIPVSCMRSPGQFSHPFIVRAKNEITAAALANNLVSSHNLTIDHRNLEQVRQDARIAQKRFGFLRMWCLHPTQIVPIVEAMRPSKVEIDQAEDVLNLAHKNNWLQMFYDGKMIGREDYRHYWLILYRAKANGIQLSEGTLEKFFKDYSSNCVI